MGRVLDFDWLARLELLERLEQLGEVGWLHCGSQEGHVVWQACGWNPQVNTPGVGVAPPQVVLVLANRER